jgi:hypothetical protein
MKPASPPVRHSKARGIAWILFSAGLFLMGPVLCAVSHYQTDSTEGCRAFLVIFSILGVVSFRLGRRRLARPAEDLLEKDQRPPVLYLRSFQDDVVAAMLPDEGVMDDQRRAVQSLFVGSEEQQIADVFGQIGPFVAIGRPEDDVPLAGAARIYVGGENWQERVADLMARAALVVLRAGQTPGFWWEVQRAAKFVPPQKMIFLLPALWSRATLEGFRSKLQEVAGVPVSEFPDLPPGFGSLGGILWFAADGTPRVSALSRRESFLPEDKRVAEALAETLAPVLRELRPEWAGVLSGKLQKRKRNAGRLMLGLVAYLILAFVLPAFGVGADAMLGFIMLGIVAFFVALFWLFRA